MTKTLKPERKAPKQERSKVLFEAILSAATRILAKVGFDQSTTNRIAEAAGVSIGSLYQYFPNKEALVSTLLERHIYQHVEIIESEIAELQDADPAIEIPARLIRAVLSDVIAHKGILRVIGAEIFRGGNLNAMVDGRRRIEKTVRELIFKHSDKTSGVKNLEQASYVIVSCVAGVVETIVFDDELDDILQEKVVNETIDMVTRYLT